MGPRRFRDYARAKAGAELTEADARRHRDAFFAAHPGLAAWHRRERQSTAAETRTLTGRRRLLGPDARPAVRLNGPVQGTAADGLKLALALLWERRAEVPSAVPVLAAHDEVVVECDAADAGRAGDWLRDCMVAGLGPLLDPVPVEVAVRAGRTWAGD